MAELYTYNATHLTTVREDTTEVTQAADHGAVGQGRFALDDTAGTQSIVGHKDFRYNESACANTLTFKGFIGERSYGRDAGVERSPDVGASRGIAVTVLDLNDMLNHRLIYPADGLSKAQGGRRPAETVAVRLEWLLGSNFVAFDDNGRVSYVTSKSMDKADYRNQMAGDVLADCALASGPGFNYYVVDYGSGPELVFRDDNASTADSSTLRISNVSTDVDSNHATLGANKTFAPSTDATLTRSPENVWSRIAMSYAKGTVRENRAATATAFNGERGGTSSNSNIKSEGKARDEANDLLWTHSTESDVIEVTIQVPASAVNLVYHGWRIECRFSHLATEGYGSFTWMRVLERTVRPMGADAFAYEIDLKLVPQEPAKPVTGLIQSAFGRTGDGPTNISLPNPVTLGNLLVYAVCDRGQPSPPQPNTSSTPIFGAGAWTKVPNNTNKITGYNDGIAIWVKEADATDNTGRVSNSTANWGLWEIGVTDAAATIAAITAVDETDQSESLTMNIGSLGTAASGTIAILVLGWADQTTVVEGPAMPSLSIAAGWTVELYNSAYEGGWILRNSPYTVIADAQGTGASLTASVTKGQLSLLSGIWAGAAILIDPQ